MLIYVGSNNILSHVLILQGLAAFLWSIDLFSHHKAYYYAADLAPYVKTLQVYNIWFHCLFNFWFALAKSNSVVDIHGNRWV